MKITLVVLACIGVAGCVTRTPGEVVAEGPPEVTFQAAASLNATRDCLVPKLDAIAPFVIPHTDRRPALTRPVGEGIQIYAQDETVTLYVVQLSPTPLMGTKIAVFPRRLRTQIETAVRECGGLPA